MFFQELFYCHIEKTEHFLSIQVKKIQAVIETKIMQKLSMPELMLSEFMF